MLARVGGGEGVFAAGGAALGDNAVVIVEGLVDGDVDALDGRSAGAGSLGIVFAQPHHVGVLDVLPCLLVPLCCLVVSYDQCVFREPEDASVEPGTRSISSTHSSKKHFCEGPSI